MRIVLLDTRYEISVGKLHIYKTKEEDRFYLKIRFTTFNHIS